MKLTHVETMERVTVLKETFRANRIFYLCVQGKQTSERIVSYEVPFQSLHNNNKKDLLPLQIFLSSFLNTSAMGKSPESPL